MEFCKSEFISIRFLSCYYKLYLKYIYSRVLFYRNISYFIIDWLMICYSRVGTQGLMYAWQVLHHWVTLWLHEWILYHRNCWIYWLAVIDFFISCMCNHHLRINMSSYLIFMPFNFFFLSFQTFLVVCPPPCWCGCMTDMYEWERGMPVLMWRLEDNFQESVAVSFLSRLACLWTSGWLPVPPPCLTAGVWGYRPKSLHLAFGVLGTELRESGLCKETF